MEEDYEPSVQSQRRVNPKIHDVIKKEVEKLLDAGLIYPISDSPWVSPVHCVPKKGGMTVITNEENELIPTRLVTGWRLIRRCVSGQRSFRHLKLATVTYWGTLWWPMYTATKGLRFRISIGLPSTKDAHGHCHPMALILWGPFPSSRREQVHTRGCDTFKMGLKQKALPTNDARVMLSNGVTHRLSTRNTTNKLAIRVSQSSFKAYSDRTVGENRASWSAQLDDALWAFRTAYKTPIGCTPYKLVYGKACHLPIELEHKAYWALKHTNFDVQTAGDHRKTEDFFSGKIEIPWSGTIHYVQYSYGTVELSQNSGPNFKVNGHRIKHYFGGDIPTEDFPDCEDSRACSIPQEFHILSFSLGIQYPNLID
ncbi:reverse transcriptase domain-containing protein [Tanacetum coccineum]|uniref:Reverse transcriptase domain-containing protein n=1 Tax=Tanacetum coccineum TaxID=301880 RepID=A0ABQ5H879_9ASTR